MANEQWDFLAGMYVNVCGFLMEEGSWIVNAKTWEESNRSSHGANMKQSLSIWL